MNLLKKAYVEKMIANPEIYRFVSNLLSNPPFIKMQPRWPWKHVSIRPTRVYTEDRFLS